MNTTNEEVKRENIHIELKKKKKRIILKIVRKINRGSFKSSVLKNN